MMYSVMPEDRAAIQAVLDRLIPSIPQQFHAEATPLLDQLFTSMIAEKGAAFLSELTVDVETLRDAMQAKDVETVTTLGVKYNVPQAYLMMIGVLMLNADADPTIADSMQFSGELDD